MKHRKPPQNCPGSSAIGVPSTLPKPGRHSSGMKRKETKNWKIETHCVKYQTSSSSSWKFPSL